jgi:hypothetical protein
MIASTIMMVAAASNVYTLTLDCRVMRVVGPDMEQVDELTISRQDIGNKAFISVSSKSGWLTAKRQPLIETSIEDGSDAPAWLVETADGPRYFEVISHSSRNGSGSGVLISSYHMKAVAGIPEDFFQYHAAGLCSAQSRNAK